MGKNWQNSPRLKQDFPECQDFQGGSKMKIQLFHLTSGSFSSTFSSMINGFINTFLTSSIPTKDFKLIHYF